MVLTGLHGRFELAGIEFLVKELSEFFGAKWRRFYIAATKTRLHHLHTLFKLHTSLLKEATIFTLLIFGRISRKWAEHGLHRDNDEKVLTHDVRTASELANKVN